MATIRTAGGPALGRTRRVAGGTTRELMQRMGQSTARAALIYQHATSARDRQIADELNAPVERYRQGGSYWHGNGTTAASGGPQNRRPPLVVCFDL
ncbi:hypothetical protein [Amycolatopsis thermophila]|uniref:Uncharacterized protein n=1 Tax=Amycolatopsis thermophila TaxID=206084 RepID=A0ABU0EMX3_9PSEU|nr:hypothetical protein [Amycolatopsis thermophila]MDQ0376640.1 hypothetical protein [Amycolatopsis thermophila]